MSRLLFVLPAVVLALGCGASSEVAPSTATTVAVTSTPRETATPAGIEATSSPTVPLTETPTVEPPVRSIRVTRLVIPSIGIDEEVQGSEVVPATGAMPPGCPARPEGQTTLSVPASGIATPVETWDGSEGTSWIYGHSRWRGEPGVLFALQQLERGDELYVDGFERASGETVEGMPFVVAGIYLADTDSGGTLVNIAAGGEPPRQPRVVLQTSVRERGAGSPWILDRALVESKAEMLVEGDLEDPCKYLLLFVVAEAG